MSSTLAEQHSHQISYDFNVRTPPPTNAGGGDVYNISGQAQVHLGDAYVSSRGLQQNALAKLIERLTYPQITARGHQITQAFPATFDWMLQVQSLAEPKIDCFVSWLSDESTSNGIYWINGKPGSGKSTMSKFLDSRLRLGKLVVSREVPVLRAQYFFWSGGQSLEKCVEGMCRSLILQLLQQQPSLIDVAAPLLNDIELLPTCTQWNKTGLSDCLIEMCQQVTQQSRILLLIDGMDECIDKDEEQSDLIDLLLRLGELNNIKIIVTSRPENIFHDSFQDFPQVQMERLTHADIQHYVYSKLKGQKRWKQLEQEDGVSAHRLVEKIISHADGVFLWVVLVIRELLPDLRNGDSLLQLQKKIDDIPPDLEKYFLRIVESIEPTHRAEASKLIQLTAFDEVEYPSTLGFRLVDAFFTGETTTLFAHSGNVELSGFDLRDLAAFGAKLAGTLRRIKSRCKGLLECVYSEEFFLENAPSRVVDAEMLVQQDSTSSLSWLNEVYDLTINFLHRSFHDFVLLPQTQTLLQSFTENAGFDARGYLINARALQVAAITQFGFWRTSGGSSLVEEATCVASHLLTALSMYEDDKQMLPLITFLEEPITALANVAYSDSGWYIVSCFDAWDAEKANFLSLAIDFGLTDYVRVKMTREAIVHKKGRPLLDHILRPRFYTERGPSYSFPSINLTELALKNGADPNQPFVTGGPTVWTAFLWSIRHRNWQYEPSASLLDFENATLLTLVHLLLDAGAAPFVPKRWINQLHHASKACEYRYSEAASRAEEDATRNADLTAPLVSIIELLDNIASGEPHVQLMAKIRALQHPWLLANALGSTQIVSANLSIPTRRGSLQDEQGPQFPQQDEVFIRYLGRQHRGRQELQQ